MTWRAKLGWAVAIAIWLAGLIITVAAGAYVVDEWGTHLDEARSMETSRWAVDEQFPARPPGTPLYDYDLPARLRETNREHGGEIAVCALVAAGLVAAPFGVRRWIPRERRPGRRVWLLAVPVLALLGVGLLAGLGYALRGFIKG